MYRKNSLKKGLDTGAEVEADRDLNDSRVSSSPSSSQKSHGKKAKNKHNNNDDTSTKKKKNDRRKRSTTSSASSSSSSTSVVSPASSSSSSSSLRKLARLPSKSSSVSTSASSFLSSSPSSSASSAKGASVQASRSRRRLEEEFANVDWVISSEDEDKKDKKDKNGDKEEDVDEEVYVGKEKETVKEKEKDWESGKGKESGKDEKTRKKGKEKRAESEGEILAVGQANGTNEKVAVTFEKENDSDKRKDKESHQDNQAKRSSELTAAVAQGNVRTGNSPSSSSATVAPTNTPKSNNASPSSSNNNTSVFKSGTSSRDEVKASTSTTTASDVVAKSSGDAKSRNKDKARKLQEKREAHSKRLEQIRQLQEEKQTKMNKVRQLRKMIEQREAMAKDAAMVGKATSNSNPNINLVKGTKSDAAETGGAGAATAPSSVSSASSSAAAEAARKKSVLIESRQSIWTSPPNSARGTTPKQPEVDKIEERKRVVLERAFSFRSTKLRFENVAGFTSANNSPSLGSSSSHPNLRTPGIMSQDLPRIGFDDVHTRSAVFRKEDDETMKADNPQLSDSDGSVNTQKPYSHSRKRSLPYVPVLNLGATSEDDRNSNAISASAPASLDRTRGNDANHGIAALRGNAEIAALIEAAATALEAEQISRSQSEEMITTTSPSEESTTLAKPQSSEQPTETRSAVNDSVLSATTSTPASPEPQQPQTQPTDEILTQGEMAEKAEPVEGEKTEATTQAQTPAPVLTEDEVRKKREEEEIEMANQQFEARLNTLMQQIRQAIDTKRERSASMSEDSPKSPRVVSPRGLRSPIAIAANSVHNSPMAAGRPLSPRGVASDTGANRMVVEPLVSAGSPQVSMSSASSSTSSSSSSSSVSSNSAVAPRSPEVKIKKSMPTESSDGNLKQQRKVLIKEEKEKEKEKKERSAPNLLKIFGAKKHPVARASADSFESEDSDEESGELEEIRRQVDSVDNRKRQQSPAALGSQSRVKSTNDLSENMHRVDSKREKDKDKEEKSRARGFLRRLSMHGDNKSKSSLKLQTKKNIEEKKEQEEEAEEQEEAFDEKRLYEDLGEMMKVPSGAQGFGEGTLRFYSKMSKGATPPVSTEIPTIVVAQRNHSPASESGETSNGPIERKVLKEESKPKKEEAEKEQLVLPRGPTEIAKETRDEEKDKENKNGTNANEKDKPKEKEKEKVPVKEKDVAKAEPARVSKEKTAVRKKEDDSDSDSEGPKEGVTRVILRKKATKEKEINAQEEELTVMAEQIRKLEEEVAFLRLEEEKVEDKKDTQKNDKAKGETTTGNSKSKAEEGASAIKFGWEIGPSTSESDMEGGSGIGSNPGSKIGTGRSRSSSAAEGSRIESRELRKSNSARASGRFEDDVFTKLNSQRALPSIWF